MTPLAGNCGNRGAATLLVSIAANRLVPDKRGNRTSGFFYFPVDAHNQDSPNYQYRKITSFTKTH
jgi:hypothetical protein